MLSLLCSVSVVSYDASSREQQCFGQNTYGQLGQGDTDARGSSGATMGDALDPVDLGSTSAVVAMAAGDAHTCIILDGGTLKVPGGRVVLDGVFMEDLKFCRTLRCCVCIYICILVGRKSISCTAKRPPKLASVFSL